MRAHTYTHTPYTYPRKSGNVQHKHVQHILLHVFFSKHSFKRTSLSTCKKNYLCLHFPLKLHCLNSNRKCSLNYGKGWDSHWRPKCGDTIFYVLCCTLKCLETVGICQTNRMTFKNKSQRLRFRSLVGGPK